MATFRVGVTKGKKHSKRAAKKAYRGEKIHGIVRNKAGRVGGRM